MRPAAVDLFAGAGGMSLGFEQAGFDVACAVEHDPVHCAVHAWNFPLTPVLCRDVETVTGEEIRRVSGLGTRPVSVVFGGSPCQGFSMIGKRSLDDPRNALVSHFARLVHELEPDHFVLENVKGLTTGHHRKFLDEVVEEFDRIGYDTVMPWKVLNAFWFGVPQHRERLFLIGSRRGVALPSYPERRFNAPGKSRPVPGLPDCPTVEDAIGDLPEATDHEGLVSSDETEAAFGTPSPYAAVLRGLSDDPGDHSARRPLSPGILTSSMRAHHGDVSRARFSAAPHGTVEPVSRFLKLDPAGICNTLRAGTGKERGAFTAARPIHPRSPRCITVREMARLHSYPDWFRFHRTKWHGARQVGNSVPPLLARAVAAEIMKAAGHRPVRPPPIESLPDTELLGLDRSAAEKMFSKDSQHQ